MDGWMDGWMDGIELWTDGDENQQNGMLGFVNKNI